MLAAGHGHAVVEPVGVMAGNIASITTNLLGVGGGRAWERLWMD